MKIIAYIAAAILIFFGVLFVWGAGGEESTSHQPLSPVRRA